MLNDSLKEWLYWCCVWIVTASILMTLSGSALFAFIASLWLGGTVAVARKFGYGFALGYAVIFGFAFTALVLLPFDSPIRGERPPPLVFRVLLASVFGLVGGSVVLAVAAAFDGLRRFILCRRSQA